MKAELFKRTTETVTIDGVDFEALIDLDKEEKVLELDQLDEVRIGEERLVFFRGEDTIAIGRVYNRTSRKAFRLAIDGEEIPTAGDEFGRCRYYYSHTGDAVKGTL